MQIIEQVKALLDIDDNLQDNRLSVIQNLTEAHFKAFSNQDTIPEKLQYIIVEVMVKRFNKLGSEGMTTQNVEGLSMTFEIDDFSEYEKVIKQHFSSNFEAGFKML
ncbi:phage head-tail adapter protein [Parabacteroides distasonis]|uniref:Phage head-tail adapter protein n=4 Tax=Bacteria TaxID=2 RepID=A0A7K0GNA4_PARDI|nr:MULTISPECIES: phage head-tail connector protein [Bacteria]KAA4132191.1 phage head-tail connector protein [Bacteroides ovatus]KAB3574806.1 phage head-tail connector protein [Phocaeicola vulgatus]KAB4648715.1 phage head-tail connector protein [Bacteroides thetaiotaomicron]MTN58662.1 phage head-tail adapter protein [Turicibacter sanguinis]MTS58934.1 phage head-tail adapter protein [Pseudoflavonifractor sp. BIOML-A6]